MERELVAIIFISESKRDIDWCSRTILEASKDWLISKI